MYLVVSVVTIVVVCPFLLKSIDTWGVPIVRHRGVVKGSGTAFLPFLDFCHAGSPHPETRTIQVPRIEVRLDDGSCLGWIGDGATTLRQGQAVECGVRNGRLSRPRIVDLSPIH